MVPAWIAQLTRGVLALALGVTITLTLAHTPVFGLLTFGAFAVLSGGILLVAALRGTYAGRMRPAFLAQAGVTLAAGLVALVFSGAGIAFLAILVGAWAVVVGVLEGASGILGRSASPLGRDWLITGILTVVLGLVALLLPPDFVQAFSGDKGVSGTLTSSVILIGVLGAWAILVGVLQTISAISVRGDRTVQAVAS